jgi:Pyruvate/2-oxoacid:ferredoxin oxidoreductase gamma subunit
MKVKDLKKRLIGEKDDADVVVVLDKSDIEKINKIAKTEPAIFMLDTEVSPDLVDNKVTIFVT